MARKNIIDQKLIVKRFSCIENAEIEFRPITLFVGPQGSGKSLLCKLSYFCQQPFSMIGPALQEGLNYSKFCERLALDFLDWFPPTAWGPHRFEIQLTSGDYGIDIRRRSGRGGVKGDVSVELSDAFRSLYTEIFEGLQEQQKSTRKSTRIGGAPILHSWSFQRQINLSFLRAFSSDWTESQTYVPAGRAFFTTVGKAIAAFDQSRMFDPITRTFGREFIAYREDLTYGWTHSFSTKKDAKADGQLRDQKLTSIFAGQIAKERDELVVKTEDGRVIPFFALSSGQQELFPLWLSIREYWNQLMYNDKKSGRFCLFIEEPEAHLFPSAQAQIVEVFANIIRMDAAPSSITLTSHSPYILAKANNLIKAGRLGFRKRSERQEAVNNVVERRFWILPDEMSAYHVGFGSSRNIIDDAGLISAEYIDEISEEILKEFEELLDIEYP